MKFFDLLKQPKATAAELREAVANLSVAKAEAVVSELEARRRSELLAGNYPAVDELDNEIKIANREVERVAASIEELTGRIADAEKRETVEALDQIEAEQLDNWHAIRKAYLEIDAACEKILPALDALRTADENFRENNRKLGAGGRTDAKIVHPMDMLRVKLNRQPGNIQTVASIVLPGYYPQRHPDNINFGSLKDIKL